MAVRSATPQPLWGIASALSGEYARTCAASYRFTFQGQEHDDELNGSAGTSYAFEYRMHDPRLGRFLSIDPLAAKYPHNSPYAFSENRVIDGVELEGLEHVNNKYWVSVNAQGKPVIELFASDDAADPGDNGWGVHMRFFDKQSGQEIKEMTAFAPTEEPWLWFEPNGNAYFLGTQVGARSSAFEGEVGFKNGGGQIMLGSVGLVLGGASFYAGGMTLWEMIVATAGTATSADDITAGSGKGTLLENLVGKDGSDKLKLGIDLLSLSGGLRSLLTNSSVTKGNVIVENKEYDNFLVDLINVVNDEVNSLMGIEERATDE
jgi:RHS repeat-associated protein